ncbi:MAG: stage IV sporulation protein A, partial [Clostridia bacterium]
MNSIYGDIARRTKGDIYIGVVGPVRTGKSTFIKKFMDTIVIPNISDQYQRTRAQDELPQSAAGRTIMTTEPKFIPNEAVSIAFDDNTSFRVRLIDCVGYIVSSAKGHTEDDQPRMVSTPWFEEDIEFDKAAEIGTRKVICEHSTIGIVMTTDGSICDIPRYDYIAAEERVVSELKEIDKPFIIVLNSAHPSDPQTGKLRQELEEKYKTPVVAVSCVDLSSGDIEEIIKAVLYEFPLNEISINLPKWIDALPMDHYLKSSIFTSVRDGLLPLYKISQLKAAAKALSDNEYIKSAAVEKISPDCGNAEISVTAKDGLFYKVISETTGIELKDDEALIDFITEMAKVQKKYSKLEYALHEVEQTGYGIV